MELRSATRAVGVPEQRLWDRLNKVWGEERAVDVALRLSDHNNAHRKIPLTDADPVWKTA